MSSRHTLARCAAVGGLVATALAACGGGDAPPTGPGGAPAPTTYTPLRQLLQARGHRIGVGTAVGSLFYRTDALGDQYRSVLAREFDVVTAENEMKMGPLRPSRGTFDYARADALVAFAEANGMRVRGHTLVWHQQNPSWLDAGGWSPAEARTLLDEHVTNVVTRYRGRVMAWDVVNEALAEDGTLRPTFWSNALGRGYIEQAFRTAAAADPDARLFYNDYAIEWPNAKADSTYEMLRDLRQRGVPVHGIGFQMHLIGGNIPSRSQLEQSFARFAALGLRIHVTELDVRVPLPSTPASLQTQAQNYRTVFEVCVQSPACDMIVVWGFTDRESWVPSTFAGQGDALLFDATFAPKPAYAAVNDFLAGR